MFRITPASQLPDRCPYPRPFADHFDACPAFQAATFTATDSHSKLLGTWQTCRHLTSGTHPNETGRYYPRCALGSRADRVRVLSEVSLSAVQVAASTLDPLTPPSPGVR